MSTAHNLDGERDVSLMALEQYLREVRWIAEMTDEDEACLLELIGHGKVEQQKPSPDEQVLERARQARERLVEGFQRLVIAIASRYARQFPTLDVNDLIQEGNSGLLEAIDREEHLPGRHFVGLASRCIAFAVCDAIQRRHLIHVTDHLHKLFRKVHHAQKRVQVASAVEPSVSELAQEMGTSEAEVRDVLFWRQRCQVESLQGCLAEDEDEDKIHISSVYGQATARDEASCQWVQQAVTDACERVLTPRQRTVVGMRFEVGSYDGPFLTYHEAAAELGVTPSAVCQMEKTAHKRLARALVSLTEGSHHVLVA